MQSGPAAATSAWEFWWKGQTCSPCCVPEVDVVAEICFPPPSLFNPLSSTFLIQSENTYPTLIISNSQVFKATQRNFFQITF